MYVTFTVIPYNRHGVNNYVNFFMTAAVFQRGRTEHSCYLPRCGPTRSARPIGWEKGKVEWPGHPIFTRLDGINVPKVKR